MRPPLRLAALSGALLTAIALQVVGCGSGEGYRWGTLYRDDVQTVAVPVFHNTTYDRGVEIDLTKAVIQHLEATTPYKSVPRERADAVLEGEIVDSRLSTLSSDPDSAIPQEQVLSLSVNFVFKDLRTGRIIAERRGFEQTATYYPTLGEGRFVSRQQAVERLAQAIVQQLQGEW